MTKTSSRPSVTAFVVAMRHHLVVVALAVLTSQIAVTAIVPVVLDGRGTSSTLSTSDAACTCAHSPGAVCPMHKAPPPPKHDGAPGQARWCNGCTDPTDAIVSSSLVGVSDLPELRCDLDRAVQRGDKTLVLVAFPLDFDRPPVAPPPRS